jgi:hypothetical protein
VPSWERVPAGRPLKWKIRRLIQDTKGGIMPYYDGTIYRYVLRVWTPNVPLTYQREIHVKGDFGTAFLVFVPEGGQLGTNGKRPDKDIFDLYFWDSAWAPMVDILRNEKPCYFSFSSERNTGLIYTGEEPTGEEEFR